jgi:uncharacterized protein (TIGR03067 family)
MRRWITCGLAVAAVLVLRAQAQDSKDRQELARVKGSWTVVSEEKNGKLETADTVRGKQVRITDDTITCMNKSGTTDMSARFMADTSKRPWHLDLTYTDGEHKGQKARAIAEVSGDTLRLCVADPNAPAPTDFKAKAHECCFTLKRADKSGGGR